MNLLLSAASLRRLCCGAVAAGAGKLGDACPA
jgi:hypothetical protein